LGREKQPVDDFLQIEGELIQVNSIANGGLQLEVTRGMHESIAAAHPAGAVVYLLERKTSMVSFVPGFFGSPAGGNYTHTLFLPDVRVGAAEFYVINDYGHSPVKHIPYTSTPDGGLRTMSGGQIALQVDGYLAVQTNAAPPFVMDEVVAVKDIFATVRSAPSGGPIQLQVRQNSAVYCTLTIADGATVSNTVSGFGLPPLAAGAQVNLDVVSVPSAANTLPGRDLTVTIRL
jgi:hypothetical protein